MTGGTGIGLQIGAGTTQAGMRAVGSVEGEERRIVRAARTIAVRVRHAMTVPTVPVYPRALVEEGHDLALHARHGPKQRTRLLPAHETRQHHT